MSFSRRSLLVQAATISGLPNYETFCDYSVRSIALDCLPKAKAEDPLDYWASALANAEAIHNYDCLVKSETVHIPTEEIAGEYGGYTEERVERVILDIDQRVCFYVLHKKYVADDSKKPPPAKVELPLNGRAGVYTSMNAPF